MTKFSLQPSKPEAHAWTPDLIHGLIHLHDPPSSVRPGRRRRRSSGCDAQVREVEAIDWTPGLDRRALIRPLGACPVWRESVGERGWPCRTGKESGVDMRRSIYSSRILKGIEDLRSWTTRRISLFPHGLSFHTMVHDGSLCYLFLGSIGGRFQYE